MTRRAPRDCRARLDSRRHRECGRRLSWRRSLCLVSWIRGGVGVFGLANNRPSKGWPLAGPTFLGEGSAFGLANNRLGLRPCKQPTRPSALQTTDHLRVGPWPGRPFRVERHGVTPRPRPAVYVLGSALCHRPQRGCRPKVWNFWLGSRALYER